MLAESYVDDEDDAVDEADLDETNNAAEEENEACDDLAEGDITALAEEAESEEKPVEDVEEMVKNDDIDNTDFFDDEDIELPEEDKENLE
jgi:hypothetical protein